MEDRFIILDEEKKIGFNPSHSRRHWNNGMGDETLFETPTKQWVLDRYDSLKSHCELISYEDAVQWLHDEGYTDVPEIDYSSIKGYTVI